MAPRASSVGEDAVAGGVDTTGKLNHVTVDGVAESFTLSIG